MPVQPVGLESGLPPGGALAWAGSPLVSSRGEGGGHIRVERPSTALLGIHILSFHILKHTQFFTFQIMYHFLPDSRMCTSNNGNKMFKEKFDSPSSCNTSSECQPLHFLTHKTGITSGRDANEASQRRWHHT